MLPPSVYAQVCRQAAVPMFHTNPTASKDGFSSQDRQIFLDKIQVTGSRQLIQAGATLPQLTQAGVLETSRGRLTWQKPKHTSTSEGDS